MGLKSFLSSAASAVTNSIIKQQTGSAPGSTALPKPSISVGQIAANTTNSIIKQQTGLDVTTGRVTPAGSSARSPYVGSVSYGGGDGGSYGYYDPVSASPYAASAFTLPNYPNAELASQYGMSQATAYREALANTAIQRRMADYKAAGLNPVLAGMYNSGAAVFDGDVDYPMSFGGSSGVSVASNSGGAYSAGGFGSYGSSSSAKGAFSVSKFLKDYNNRAGVASVVSGLTAAVTKSFYAGAAAYYFTNSALSALSRRR